MTPTDAKDYLDGLTLENPGKPWIPWYVKDWLQHPTVRALRPAARAVLFDFLMMSWFGSPRGTVSAERMEQFASIACGNRPQNCRQFKAIWALLLRLKLVSPQRNGGFYSRRILREHGGLSDPPKPEVSGVRREHKQTQKQEARDHNHKQPIDDVIAGDDTNTLTGVCDIVARIGGANFRHKTWRARILAVAANNGIPELLHTVDKVSASLRGRGERIDNPGGFIGAAIMRLAKGERQC